MNVLCGVDGSAGSFDAVRFGVRLLNPTADQVGFYYTPPALRLGPESGATLAARLRMTLAHDVFNECRRQLPRSFAERVHTIIGTERPQRGLLTAAHEWQAGMIVVGARGLGSIMRLLLGSVSSDVAQSATVPVLVVRPAPKHRADDSLRVLFAFDGSTAARHAGDFLGRLTWPANTIGQLMTVAESMFAGEIPEWLEKQARETEIEAMAQTWVREHEEHKRAAHDQLLTYSQKLPHDFRHDPLVAEGDPANEILKNIDREGSDLVILGARGLGALQRIFLGSTSQKVLNHAPCSVLIVHQAETERQQIHEPQP